jgi:hypothetical protein
MADRPRLLLPIFLLTEALLTLILQKKAHPLRRQLLIHRLWAKTALAHVGQAPSEKEAERIEQAS